VQLVATIVRAILLPAAMTLLGDWNWYLPRWLERLPRLSPTPSLGPPSIGATSRTLAARPAPEHRTPVGV
jgi:RND superfamily putative drug exporter